MRGEIREGKSSREERGCVGRERERDERGEEEQRRGKGVG